MYRFLFEKPILAAAIADYHVAKLSKHFNNLEHFCCEEKAHYRSGR